MEGSNPLLPHQTNAATFGGSASALARLGRPLPGPFAHFASPIAPYTMPSFGGGGGGGPQSAPNPTMFPDSGNPLHSTLASMAAYSFDSLLSANFNNFANLLMMGPNNPNVAFGALQPSLLGAFGGQHQSTHSPSPTSTSPSPNYFRRDTPTNHNETNTNCVANGKVLGSSTPTTLVINNTNTNSTKTNNRKGNICSIIIIIIQFGSILKVLLNIDDEIG